jgi:FKBP-type peptidyl-prolyl cis-trans isomerase FklB
MSLPLPALILVTGQVSTEDDAALSSAKDKLSYAPGMDLGDPLRRLSVQVDPAAFGQALADALAGGKTLMTPDQARAQIAALQAEMRRRQAEVHALSRDNRNTGASRPAAQPAAGAAKADALRPQ